MKWKKIRLAIKLRRKINMELEIVMSREYFSLVDQDGKELTNVCNFRVRYCVREKGASKPLKCFSTFDKAKKYRDELIEASRPKLK